MYPVPRFLKQISLAVSALLLLSGVAGAALALMAPVLSANGHVAWVLAGFELVTITAAVFGVLVGLGRYSQAPGLALACVAGTVLLASTLAWQGSARNFLGTSLTPFLLARWAGAGLLALVGAACVLGRDPRAWRWALTGAAMATPALLVAPAFATDSGWRVLDRVLGSNSIQRVVVGSVGAVTIGVLLAAGGHLVIRAFELGRREDPVPGVTSSRSAGA